MNSMQHNQKGFTLIEVIITIVIAAMVGLVIFTYLGNVLTRSHEPIVLTRDLGEAIAVMEDVVEEYQSYLTGGTWDVFTDSLNATVTDNPGVSYENRKGEGSFKDDFDIIEVTITRGDQTVSAIFTE